MDSQSLINVTDQKAHYINLIKKLIMQLTPDEKINLLSNSPSEPNQESSKNYQLIHDLIKVGSNESAKNEEKEIAALIMETLEKIINDNIVSLNSKKFNEQQPIYTLPDELLLEIFSHLSLKVQAINSRLTSQRFFKVIRHTDLINQLPILNYDEYHPQGNHIYEPSECRVDFGVMLSKKRLAICDMAHEKAINIYDLQNNTKLAFLNEHRGGITDILLFSNDILISCSYDGTIKFWDLNQYQCTRTLKLDINTRVDGITKMELISNNTLSCGSEQGDIRILDLSKNDNETCIRTLSKHKLPINLIKKLPHNKLACSYRGDNNEILIWDLNQPETNLNPVAKLTHDKNPLLCMVSSNFLASASTHDNHIKIWNLNDYSCIKTIEAGNEYQRVTSIEKLSSHRFACSIQRTIGIDKYCTFKIYDTEQLKYLYSFDPISRPLSYNSSGIFKLNLQPDGRLMIYRNQGSEFEVHDFKGSEPRL